MLSYEEIKNRQNEWNVIIAKNNRTEEEESRMFQLLFDAIYYKSLGRRIENAYDFAIDRTLEWDLRFKNGSKYYNLNQIAEWAILGRKPTNQQQFENEVIYSDLMEINAAEEA